MNRKILKISLLVISLLIFQFGILPPMHLDEGSAPLVAAVPVPVNGMASTIINDTDPDDSFEVQIIEPGIYRFNLSFFVDIAMPAGVDIDTDWYQTMDAWWPGVGTSFRSMDQFLSYNFNNYDENDTDYYDTELVCIRPGYIRISLDLSSYSAGDQVSLNLTVDQCLVFGALPDASFMGENTTLEWTTDHTWQGFRLHLPDNNFYNLTAYGSLNWSTTAGWGGDGSFTPLYGVSLIDLNHGQYMPYETWTPVYSIPAGPEDNSSAWGPIMERHVLTGGVYYLIGLSETFEFLNNSMTTFTLNYDYIPTTPLIPGVPLRLQFNTTPNVYDAWISVTIPEGHYFNAYFTDPSGYNWTVATYDAWAGGFTSPYFETYEDPVHRYTDEYRLERGYATAQGGGFPMPSVLENPYLEMWYATATMTFFTNDSITGAAPPGGPGIMSRFNTFYMWVDAWPHGVSSETFNITGNLELIPFPMLTPAGLTVDFNSTIGPYYHCFSIPQSSGGVYEVSAIATEYTASGTVGVQDYIQPESYRDWQYFSVFGPALGYEDPDAGMGYSINTNDTAMLKYVSTRDILNFMWVHGPGMVGGDMTEANVSLSSSPPAPYLVGTVVTADLELDDFTSISFDVTAGTTYALILELMPDGEVAYGYFMNIFGDNPFVIGSMFSAIIAASISFPFSMVYEGTFTARFTGRISFVLVGEGTVNLIIGPAGPPLSPMMIAAIIGVAIIMLIVGLFVGYLVWKRPRS